MSTSALNLNWREWQEYGRQLSRQLAGARVDRLFVPERSSVKGGYLKNEWCLRLRGGVQVLVSSRSGHPFLGLRQKKGLRKASAATKSAFTEFLVKKLVGQRVDRLEVVDKERVLILWFRHGLGWVLNMIPAQAESLLINEDHKILAASRSKPGGRYQPPQGGRAPDLPVRSQLDPAHLMEHYDQNLRAEGTGQRLKSVQAKLKSELQRARKKLRQTAQTIKKIESEPDWQHLADIFKANLHVKRPRAKQVELDDYTTGEKIKIPLDPKLDGAAQLEKLYAKARRNKKKQIEAVARNQEAAARVRFLEEKAARLEPEKLDEIEAELGLVRSTVRKPKRKWPGRVFESEEGLQIWVGRSREENSELTFRHARGNDLWLHVRGRPGAHVVIPLQGKRTASLETLKDAACLAIHYSGGKNWGKAEVDYTQKKNVKRIKKSTEVSYTKNKTLLVELEQHRLDRLLAQ